jgi:hypothetical protein
VQTLKFPGKGIGSLKNINSISTGSVVWLTPSLSALLAGKIGLCAQVALSIENIQYISTVVLGGP